MNEWSFYFYWYFGIYDEWYVKKNVSISFLFKKILNFRVLLLNSYKLWKYFNLRKNILNI